MTKRKNRDLIKIGKIIYDHRMNLSLEKESRKFFLDDRVNKGLLEEGDISEKTLINIENGYNLPSLVTLNYLATALEIDLLELIEEVKGYIPRR
ncbi:helix-turn-helix domain-containing protein [Priestia endophytica]|uniref:helix-turn-helix domain-containing protein n=1 Tax=Priestia endophytica TaxID=135735 RepID=UPI003D2E174B